MTTTERSEDGRKGRTMTWTKLVLATLALIAIFNVAMFFWVQIVHQIAGDNVVLGITLALSPLVMIAIMGAIYADLKGSGV